MTAPGPAPARTVYEEAARAAAPTSPLEGDRRVAVAIVGGGITGLSTALHLAGHGIRATVLETHEPGFGASGRNGGQVNPGFHADPGRIERAFGSDLGRRMLDLSLDAPHRVFALIRRHAIPCEAEQTGTLRLAVNHNGRRRLAETFKQYAKRNATVEWLDRNGAVDATGAGQYFGAILFRQGGKLNPLAYVRGLVAAALNAGAKIHANTPALEVKRAAGRWTVRTPTGTLDADHLVIATNGYTGDLWPRLRGSIIPAYSTIVATEPLPDNLARHILPTGAVAYEAGRIPIYFRLDRRHRLLMGGRGVQDEIRSPDEVMHLVAYAEQLWPALLGMRWTHAWNGQIAVTSDRYPHWHEPAENVHICVGYSGRGIAMATAMGDLIAQRIAGARPQDLPMPITRLRGIPLQGFWRPAMAARLSASRLLDRFGL